MPVYVSARFQGRAETFDTSLHAIEDFIAAVKAKEPRTIYYTSWQETDDPTRFLHTFAFADEATEADHRVTAWVKQFVDLLYPELVSDGVEFRHYTVAATT